MSNTTYTLPPLPPTPSSSQSQRQRPPLGTLLSYPSLTTPCRPKTKPTHSVVGLTPLQPLRAVNPLRPHDSNTPFNYVGRLDNKPAPGQENYTAFPYTPSPTNASSPYSIGAHSSYFTTPQQQQPPIRSLMPTNTPITPTGPYDLAGLMPPKSFHGEYPDKFLNSEPVPKENTSAKEPEISLNPCDYFMDLGEKSRMTFTSEQRELLLVAWSLTFTPGKHEGQRLGAWMMISTKKTITWFQNRRQERTYVEKQGITIPDGPSQPQYQGDKVRDPETGKFVATSPRLLPCIVPPSEEKKRVVQAIMDGTFSRDEYYGILKSRGSVTPRLAPPVLGRGEKTSLDQLLDARESKRPKGPRKLANHLNLNLDIPDISVLMSSSPADRSPMSSGPRIEISGSSQSGSDSPETLSPSTPMEERASSFSSSTTVDSLGCGFTIYKSGQSGDEEDPRVIEAAKILLMLTGTGKRKREDEEQQQES